MLASKYANHYLIFFISSVPTFARPVQRQQDSDIGETK